MLKIKKQSKKVKVLMCAAECVPLAKVGGLADVVGSLPAALKKEGVVARILMPAHGTISLKRLKARLLSDFYVMARGKKERVYIYEASVAGTHFYLLKNKNYFSEDVYIGDNAAKYLFFCRAAIEAIKNISFVPDLIHAHDFHAAPIIAELGSVNRKKRPGLIQTIHNLRHQGHVDAEVLAQFGFLLSDFPNSSTSKNNKTIVNLLAASILRADKITTVSPNYAKEILTAEYGYGLETILRSRKKDLVGILNGIDVNDFNPQTDDRLAQPYGVKNVKSGKEVNKDAVLAYFKMTANDLPLFIFIARFSGQKGLELLNAKALSDLNRQYPFQMILLGSGEKPLEKLASNISVDIGDNARTLVAFDETLARNLYAASDYFLVPSLFEPCGLTQMIAMRYGSVPLVRATGGLKDTVRDGRTGLVFESYSSAAFIASFKKALVLYYKNKKKFDRIQASGLHKDWSWDASAPLYAALYKKI
ncbi:MAG: glycogen/starch synthase [bacterium]|nr:glycogen/starch synthase [bacterium]